MDILDLVKDETVVKALDFARLSLAGQKRKSGEDIIDHCERVAKILLSYKITDPATLSTALLHHSLSEGAATAADIKTEFGEDIASMVESFESLRIIRGKAGMKDEFAENLRKMFLTLARDLRVVFIKLADILDNLTTLEYLEEAKRKEVASETLDIFAPLAERLGMGEMRGTMQDLAFLHLYPREYKWVQNYTKGRLENLGKVMLKIKGKLVNELKDEGMDAEIQSRVKHIYSLYAKLLRPEVDKDLNKIYDLIALRVIVPSIEDCYRALDIIHGLFPPFGNRVSDYIAHPKPSGYRSIHTRVMGPNNLIFEIQIRSRRMHEEAEFGLAAHWNYNDKKSKGVSGGKLDNVITGGDKLEWVKRLGEWQEEIVDNTEFLKTVKTDLFGRRIFVFTPKGDVKDLPEGATPIDFAYSIHTVLGGLTMGAKVNGKMVPLSFKLKNADVVEIIVSKDNHKKPNRDWMEFVVSNVAKRRIKKALLG